MATPFDFKGWCDTKGLKKETSELLTKQDLDTKEALVLVTESDITNLEMTLGQRKLFFLGIRALDIAIKTRFKTFSAPGVVSIVNSSRENKNVLKIRCAEQ